MIDNRTTELLPCPFCGGEAHVIASSDGYGVECWGELCAMNQLEEIPTEAEAIAAWNTRADTEYGGIPATEQNMAKYGWVRERTCEPKWTLQGETQTQEFWRCDCGNCGECFGVESRESFPFKMTVGKVDIPNYCPNCGAKVVSA